jgi:hypothetical protein
MRQFGTRSGAEGAVTNRENGKSGGRSALWSVAETSLRKKLVPALERLHGYTADANRKKAKHYEVDKHTKTNV